MSGMPEISYAHNGNIAPACTVRGSRPVDPLHVRGFVSHLGTPLEGVPGRWPVVAARGGDDA